MPGGAFEDALDGLESLCAGGVARADQVDKGLRALSAARPLEMSADALRRMLLLCYRIAGIDGPRVAIDASGQERARQSIGYMVDQIIEDTLKDRGGFNRGFIEGQAAREAALGRAGSDELFAHYIPRYSVPLTVAEAGPLLAPYLRALEAGMSEHRHAHLRICWKVLEHPLPPFEQVFRDWLAELDARGIPGGLKAITRARALVAMAEAGRQHIGWEEIETTLLPQLSSEHPMVAATLSRFLGALYAEGGRRIQGGPAWPLDRMLDHIAELPENRRPVAGGFLNGYGDFGDPLHALRNDPGVGLDLDTWVLAVLADNHPEPYLPGAQAFWFYVHEHYWASPEFVMRLIDAGHLWEALMCATEQPNETSGMEPVLRRLAACDEAEIARSARECLQRAFPEGGSAG
ncbi:MAG: hypothetical protein QNJ09_02735 [Paracoccaceae bacterium]|nr:hypothetical protein [Paracoccaceae bacterium]